MGIVYLAEQRAPLKRRVALKVLRLGLETGEALARFDSERQALAVMDHPNIAQVFDSGVTNRGRPYFVMELVHGIPITRYADDHRLTTSERIRLFLAVCGAVQHAHQKGVIHRDLKPSNVLVAVGESGPLVKVIDFGVAKTVGMGFTDRTLVTRVGQQVGTLEYMSPEQAEMSGLDVDSRTDIYSLGVMLYELLVGSRPVDLSRIPGYAVPHALRERDTPRPSTKLTTLGDTLKTVVRHRRTTPSALRRELRGDLDWIILKAMAQDRTRRYDTASGLALDLARHLDHEPVLARPPSARYRLQKFVLRNRAAVVAAAVAAVALLGGAGAAVAGYLHALDEQARAERAALTAQEVEGFLVELFEHNNPGEALGRRITAWDVMTRGARRIETELEGQPEVQARLMRVMGAVYGGLGIFGDAIPLLERAVEVGEATSERDDDELIRALERLGVAYGQQGRTEEAENALNRALALAPPGSLERAGLLRRLASVETLQRRFDEARSALDEALEIQRRLLGSRHAEVGASLRVLGSVYLSEGRYEEGESLVREALGILEEALDPRHPDLAGILINLGALAQIRGSYDEAEEHHARAYEIAAPALGPGHPLTLTAVHNLGEADWARGRYAEAEERLRQALAGRTEGLGPNHPHVASTLRILANVYRDQGRYSEAEPLYRRALDVLDRSVPAGDPVLHDTRRDLGELLRLTGRAEEARELQQDPGGGSEGEGGR